MIYSCGSDGCIYLTNPIERKTVDLIMNELTSDSVLLIRSIDILKRFKPNCSNLIELIMHSDKRWQNMNVLGQIVNVLREYRINDGQTTSASTNSNCHMPTSRATISGSNNSNNNLITHVEIPASYVPGISLFVYTDSQLCKELFDVGDLPLK